MEKFKWCFIGVGSLARTVAAQLNKSDRHEIVSCYARRFDKTKEFAAKFGATAYESADEAILDKNVDAVYIVTPHNAHFRYARLALELGKPVFCEKAFTVTADETDDLISLAKEKNLYLCEAMWTWFAKTPNKVKEWINGEKIGKIQSASFTYHMKTTGRGDRHTDPKRAGGALLDITIYPITYAYRLWGIPEKIEAVGEIVGGVDFGEEIKLKYKDFDVNISASINDFHGLENMKIKGDKGEISAFMYHCTDGATMKIGGRKEKYKSGGPIFFSYLEEFDAVASDIRAGKIESDFVSLKATSDVMHILDEIRSKIGLQFDVE